MQLSHFHLPLFQSYALHQILANVWKTVSFLLYPSATRCHRKYHGSQAIKHKKISYYKK